MTSVRDARGKSFTLDRAPARVVSLVPSLTETLFALGVGSSVVGVTDFCIFPEPIGAPRLGGTKNPDVEAIRALEPDLVHMNLEENLLRHAELIEAFAPLFVTEPKAVSDVPAMIRQLGELHHVTGTADALASGIARELARPAARPFSFACPIWKKPWMWCGGDTYVSHLITAVGGRNVLADRARYPAIEAEEVFALRPDVIILPDEPYVFTEEDAQAIPLPVIGPFPGHLVTWHGVRTLPGLRFLREAVTRVSA